MTLNSKKLVCLKEPANTQSQPKPSCQSQLGAWSLALVLTVLLSGFFCLSPWCDASISHAEVCPPCHPSSQGYDPGQDHFLPSPHSSCPPQPGHLSKIATPSSHPMGRALHWGSDQVPLRDLDRSDSNTGTSDCQVGSWQNSHVLPSWG